ncbi:PB1 domain-containing protein [Heracleum sosnowskyi]|uniref:PB1 domain-containing protein n=1 Tax=Heracleum sosnowskyi TaxID=360622 RepID=A0AAD8NE80_9APIA|nr:PB1 domain-containing protein [Heracleum sosnowskyi]
MDNYSFSSLQSSPRSTSDATWDDDSQHSLGNYKIKLMCSYGGKIQPRQHDNQLTYVAGDTKIFAVDRNIKFSLFLSKLSTLSQFQPNSLCFRYQLPGEDLDALISVTNDEDLEHMMLEYDRLYRASTKPVRLRLFLFPAPSSAFSSSDSKSDRQWFVDALNSVQNQSQSQNDSASSTAVTPPLSATPDFLFGFDKDGHGEVHAPPCKVAEPVRSPKVEDRSFVNESEIERQINDIERMNLNTGNYGDFYGQKPPENVQQPPASYYQERPGNEQLYYVPANAAGVYQTQVMRPVTGQVGQGYYGMQRMVVPDVYREQPVYRVPQQQQQQQSFQQKNVGLGAYNVGPMGEQGYGQVGYDAQGRQVYYTTTVQQQFQAVDGRQGGGEMNQESR